MRPVLACTWAHTNTVKAHTRTRAHCSQNFAWANMNTITNFYKAHKRGTCTCSRGTLAHMHMTTCVRHKDNM